MRIGISYKTKITEAISKITEAQFCNYIIYLFGHTKPESKTGIKNWNQNHASSNRSLSNR